MHSYFFHEDVFHKYGKLFRIILVNRSNWTEIKPDATSYVTLGDKNSESLMQSYLTGERAFVLKHLLYQNFKNIIRMPNTAIVYRGKVSHKLKTNKNQVVFVKPSDKFTGLGQDIFIFRSQDDITVDFSKYEYWVIQEEVFPPKLINNRKYVIRYFAVACYDNDKLYLTFSDNFRVNFYEKEYSMTADPAEQISHSAVNSNTGQFTYIGSVNGLIHIDGSFFGHRELMQDTIEQMQNIFCNIIDSYKNKLISNHGKGFAVYGGDFILNAENKVYLLEVNEHPLLAFKQQILLDNITLPLLTKIIEFIEGKFDSFLKVYNINLGYDETIPLKGKHLIVGDSVAD